MTAVITEDLTPAVRRRFPAVRWSAIFCGWLVGSGIAWLMYILGLAAGFSAIDVSNLQNAAKGIGIGTGLWLLLTWAVSLFLGGMFAAWFDGKPDPVIGALHGIAVWALAMTVSVLLLASGTASVLQGGSSLLKGAAGAAATGVSTATQSGDETTGALQAEIKQQIAMGIARSAQGGNNAVNPAQVREAMDQVDRATTTAIAADLLRGNTDRAKARLAAETSLAPGEVDQIMQGLTQKSEQYKAQAREAADQAARYTAAAMWAIFVSCLIALIAAAIGGWVGASNIDRVYDTEPV